MERRMKFYPHQYNVEWVWDTSSVKGHRESILGFVGCTISMTTAQPCQGDENAPKNSTWRHSCDRVPMKLYKIWRWLDVAQGLSFAFPDKEYYQLPEVSSLSSHPSPTSSKNSHQGLVLAIIMDEFCLPFSFLEMEPCKVYCLMSGPTQHHACECYSCYCG